MKKDEKESRAEKLDKSKVKCYHCDSVGHFAAEYKKAKKSKGSSKALTTSIKDWMDSPDSEDEEVNYALMANVVEDTPPTEKVPPVVFNFDINNMSELKSFAC